MLSSHPIAEILHAGDGSEAKESENLFGNYSLDDAATFVSDDNIHLKKW